MSWLSLLQETYLFAYGSKEALEDDTPLLPVSHTTQLANVELTVDIEGNYVDASIIVGSDRTTLIPCTEDSSSRAGPGAKLRPHPLHDKLQYVAGDYEQYGGGKGGESFTIYLDQLKNWCESPFGHPYIEAVLKYVSKRRMIKDLVENQILFCDKPNHLLETWIDPKKESERNDREEIDQSQIESATDNLNVSQSKPAIFSSVNSQHEVFIRFRIRTADRLNRVKPWESKELIDSFIEYYASTQGVLGIDYATGKIMPCSITHPKKIRHTGDGAKLISSNDISGFTFRGRFASADEAVQIGYRTSQEAHNALKWLIAKQGTNIGGKVFLTWGTTNPLLPDPTDGSIDTFERIGNDVEFDDLLLDEQTGCDYKSEQFFAAKFNSAIMGYRQNLTPHCRIAVMILDAATKGRMAITFLKEFDSNDQDKYFQNLKSWQELLSWRNIAYSKRQEKTIRYVGAPSLRDIALASYGVQRGDFLDLDSHLLASTMQRLYPLVLNSSLNIPFDIVHSAFTKACRPQAYSSNNWEKVLKIACSLIKAERFQREKEIWEMDVNRESRDTVYNLGRLLAVIDAIEERSIYLSSGKDGKRATSAIRYFTKFIERPNATLGILAKQLVPYRISLDKRGTDLYVMEQEIASLIPPEDLLRVRNLDGRFLLGFDTQRSAIYKRSSDLKCQTTSIEIE